MDSKHKQRLVWEELTRRNGIINTIQNESCSNDPSQNVTTTANAKDIPNQRQSTQQQRQQPLHHNRTGTSTAASTNLDTSTVRHWPSYDELLRHLSSADYTNILTCPHDMQDFDQPINHSPTMTVPMMEPTTALDDCGRQYNTVLCPQQKILCPHGVVCCADMTIFPNVPYTGLLGTTTTTTTNISDEFDSNRGSPNTKLPCIIRLSSAMQPPSASITSSWGRTLLYALSNTKIRTAQIFPCVAIKVFRNKQSQSGNLLFGGSKVGQRETNFFAHCVCTSMTEQMPRPIKPFVSKFWTYSDFPLSLGVSDFCKFTVNGSVINDDDISFPFAIILRPRIQDYNKNSDLMSSEDLTKPRSTNDSFDSFIDQTIALPTGTILFDMYACPDPLDVPDASKLQRIGFITMTSKMIQSSSSDGLIFRHQRKEDDYKLRPEWPLALKNRV